MEEKIGFLFTEDLDGNEVADQITNLQSIKTNEYFFRYFEK